MHVLVIGGSGHVGSLVLPALAQQHTLRVLDRQPPADCNCEYMEGDLTDLQVLRRAAKGVEAVLFMAMGVFGTTAEAAIDACDVNVKGVYLALRAAHEAGVPHGVYTSTMSIYAGDLTQRYFPDESIAPDATDPYGFTKRLGEQVCANAARAWGMSVNALRLCLPTADEKWRRRAAAGHHTIATAASDLACALLAALEYRDGFQAIMISGDYEQRFMSLAKAKRVLNWQPLARPTAGD